MQKTRQGKKSRQAWLSRLDTEVYEDIEAEIVIGHACTCIIGQTHLLVQYKISLQLDSNSIDSQYFGIGAGTP